MENIYNNIEIDNSENNKKIAIKPVGSSWQETRELSQESASGEKVILNNVDPDKFIDIFADGNNRQETTTGKQLFNKDNPDFLATGSNVKYVSIEKGFKIVCNKNGTTYDGSAFKIRLGSINDFVGKLRIKTTAIISDNGNFRAGLVLYYGNASNYSESGKIAERDGNYGGTTIFDIESDITKQNNFTHLYLVVYGNSSGSAEHYMNDGDYTTYDNFIITLNNEDMTYEKYTGGIPTPNPNYKQDIEVIDGCNRFDLKKEDFSKVYGWAFTTQSNNITLKPNTQYTLRTNSTNGNDTINNCDILWGGSTPINYGVSSNNPKTITSDDNGNIPIYIRQTNIDNFFNGTNYIQITEGTEEKPYLPFGAIGLKFSGKNFLKVKNTERTINGVTFKPVYNSEGMLEYVNINGTATGDKATYILNTDDNSYFSNIKLKALTSYYFRGQNKDNVLVQCFLKINNTMSYPIENFTTVEETALGAYISVEEGKTVNNYKVYPMLEEGTTVSDYEPYHEPQLIPIGLAGNSIAKVNDSKDTLSIYRNGKVILGKKTNRYIFTGNEKLEKNTNYSTDSMLAVQFNISDMKVGTTNILCNYFKYSSSTIINSIRAAGDYILFGLDKATFTDVDSFKSYLLQQYENETAVYVDYELATLQQIELPSIDPLQLWEGTVNVELISNLETNLNVNYNIVPAMPSLEARSDIESTGEKYNIFNKDARIIISGTTKENLDTGVRVIGTIDGQYRYCSIELGKKELLGKNITMQAKIQSSNQNVGLISINFGNENSPAIKIINSFNKEYEKKVFSIPTEFPENCDRIYLILYANLNGTLKKGDYVDYKDLMVSIGSNEKPYVPYDIGAINIKQQNGNLLNTFDYTYVSGDKNITFKNGQFIFNGTWEKWLAQLYTWSLTNYWVETNYGDYMDLSKKSVNILKAGKYYLKIKYISGNISTNGGLKFTYRLDTNTTGKSLNIGEFKSNVKKGDIIKKTFEITEDTPFTLMTTMIRTEDTVYDNFTFTAILEKDEETENFEEHREVNHQMILNKPLKGIKTNDSTKANYIDENGNYWITDYVADDGIHRKIGEIILNGSKEQGEWTVNSAWDKDNTRKYCNFALKAKKDCNLLSDRFIYDKEAYVKDVSGTMMYSSYLICTVSKNIANTVEEWKQWLSENTMKLQYELAEETLEEFTQEERNTYEQLQNIQLFEGKNYINAIDNIEERFRIDVSKIIDGYYSYISNDGYFIVPELDIKYLVDFNESDIPTMPEANEATVKVAGRDGDIPLSTTYEAIPFNIVCYTEDNLSLAEKVKEEDKVNNLLNSIKNKTMTFAFEKYNKFYNVKYSGELTTINYPKCVKFTIPLKSSESYGKTLMQKMMVGNSEEESNTVKEVGGIITLGGPATNPIVSLNDYSIEYNNSILKGSRVEIDSNRSTITNINSDGVKTNVMKFYNHQFPKIENGKNTLKVLSGFDNDKQVSLKWNDLKL